MKTYQVTLPDEVAAFVESVIGEKQWDCVSDLVMYGLLRVQDELRADADIDQEALRKAIQIGVDQSSRGETAPLDMAAVWERAMKRLAGREEIAHAASNSDGSG